MKTFIPHRHSLATIAALSGFDLSAKTALTGSAGIVTSDGLKEAAVLAKHMATLKLSKEHTTEITVGLGEVVDHLKTVKAEEPGLVTTLTEQLIHSSNKLIAHVTNGDAHADPITAKRGAGEHPMAGRGL